MPENSNNINFIKTLFDGEVAKDYPNYNYRLRLAGLTEFEPYISETPRFSEETDEEYSSRVLTSGRYFGEQEILVDDLVHSDINIGGLNIPSTFYDGKIPKTLLFLEKCRLINDGKEYEVTSKNLNDLDYVKSQPPTVVFPVDLSTSDKGYVVYRKTTSVNKDSSSNAKLMESVSGWYPVTGFSNNDVKAIADAGSAVAVGFTDNNYHLDNVTRGEATEGGLNAFYPWRPTSTPDSATHYTGYESFQNELFTSYKIVDSGVLMNPPASESELTRDRTVDIKVDPSKNYSLERKVTRKSHNNTTNPSQWENIEHSVSFPYKDTENLSDYINTNINFEVSGIYDIVETTGNHSDGRDYFEVPIIEDWGKSDEETSISNREKTDELVFRSGENLKVIQRSTRKASSLFQDNVATTYDQFASVDVHFNTYSTGISGSITGASNEKNFYQLEYQLVPNVKSNKKLQFEQVSSDDAAALSVGDEIFYNTGIDGGVYKPISSNVYGETPSVIPDDKGVLSVASVQPDDSNIGASYQIGVTGKIEPEIVSDVVASGVGYSYFTSGEKYLVVPKGDYSTLFSDAYLEFDSAGENRKTFFHGEQNDNIDSDYILAEYRSFDNYIPEDPDKKIKEFIYNREREVRINKQDLCLGDSASDLPDVTDAKNPTYLLDEPIRAHQTIPTYKNATILNIDSSDGSIKLSNLKNNRQQFQERSNLFFEKNYVASQTILATGQKQSIEPLKQFIEDGKIYYLERDIYIDSDIGTQANTSSPVRGSDETDLTFSPFSVDANTRNPEAFGEEKLYLTQVFHTSRQFPYNDFDYYNNQPTIAEEFTYANHKQSIIDKFDVKNISPEAGYLPGNYDCALSAPADKIDKNQGFAVLMNSGYDSAHAAGHSIQTGSLTSDSALPVTFTPRDRNIYYEVQVRPNSISDWTTLSYAVDAHGDDTGNITVNLKHDTLITSKTANTEIRVVEWRRGAVLDNYEGLRLPNESPDSLVLKSAASNRLYDASKAEHAVTINGTVTTSQATWASSNDIYEMVFNGNDSNYLSIPSHRSLDIQNGEFSLEFWIKNAGNGQAGTIFERENAIKLSMPSTTTLKVELNKETVIASHEIGDTSSWKHIALAKVRTVSSAGESGYRLYLYIDGEAQVLQKNNDNKEFKYLECGYYDYAAKSNSALTIGKGLNAKLYQVRFYVGKSLHKGRTTDSSKNDFKVDSGKRKYRILKLNYHRRKSNRNDWIINRNQFENVGPPENYLDAIKDLSDETTFHTYEWLRASADTASSRSRALAYYMQYYAYRAPNNPHINKNYEGKPIFKDSSGNIPALNRIALDNYFFNVREQNRDSSSFSTGRAPYLYEFLDKNSDIRSMRFAKKGGEDASIIPVYGNEQTSFSSASRLRITKYVYRLYTKRAVIIGDVGHKDSRGSQSGWNYQVQYKVPAAGSSGSSGVAGYDWTDVDSIENNEDYPIFYNDTDGLRTNSFDNIDNVTLLPTLVIKTDITDKYKPEDIEFRIKKKQNIEVSDGSLNTQVLKKVNLLPMEVSIPTSGTLLDLTQKAANDKGQMDGAADSPLDSQHYSVYDQANQVAVNLDSNTTYVVYKDPNEKILLSSDTDDTLKVETVTMALDKTSTATYADIEDRKPYEVAGLTGLRVYGGSVSSLETVKSVIGPKPSGLVINRVEKSHGSIKTGENVTLDSRQTRLLYDPSITGSHLEELEDFAIYTPNDTVTRESLVQFTCSSFTTGLSDSSIETGVSGVSYKPAYDFLNSPVMTGEFTVTEDDEGKTFLVSGTNARGIFVGNNYSFDIVNISSSSVNLFNSPDAVDGSPTLTSSAERARTITVEDNAENNSNISKMFVVTSPAEPSGVVTIVPDAKVEDSVDESLVLVEDISKVSVSNSNIESACTLVNISTGDCALADGIAGRDGLGSLSGVSYNASAQRLNHVDSGVIVIDHDKIVLTENDVNITGVIDTNSTLVLPSGFANSKHVSFLNATDDEIKVVSESGYKIDSKSVDYIPRQTTRKFTCSKSESSGKTVRNWLTSNVEVVKYNQLNVTSSNNREVFIHNEDVDVRLNSNSTSEGFNFSVVRSQVNDWDGDFPRGQKTPVMRVFIDGYLQYTAPPGILGVRVDKKSYGWSFEKINVIYQSEIVIDPKAHGKIFSYAGSGGVNIKFTKGSYPDNFEFFFVSANPTSAIDFVFESEDDAYKINDQEDSGYFKYSTSISNKDLIRIAKSPNIKGEGSGGENRFYVGAVGIDSENKSSNKYKFNQPANSKERVLINRNDNFSIELPTLTEDFDYDQGFALTFVNASEGASNTLYPKEVLGGKGSITEVEKDILEPFSAVNVGYIKDEEEVETEYENFISTSVDSYSEPTLNNGDFVLLDGSLSNVALRSFFQESSPVNKYGREPDGDSSFPTSRISLSGGNKFNLRNHGLITNHKMVFSCNRLTLVDYYYESSSWNPESFNGTIGSHSISEGDTLLVYDSSSIKKYFLYIDEGDDGSGNRVLSETEFAIPDSMEGNFTDTKVSFQYNQNGPMEVRKMFVRIGAGSNEESGGTPVEAGNIYDLYSDSLSTATKKTTSNSLPFTFAAGSFVNSDVDESDLKAQTLFVKVINDNEFSLYSDKSLSSQVTYSSASDYTLFSETFYTDIIDYGKISILNLGDTQNVKAYSDDSTIVTSLTKEKSVELFHASDDSYVQGDLAFSGIHFLTGWDGSSTDTLDINSSTKQVVTSGQFHAYGALSSDTNFDNTYFINAGLDEVEVTNTDENPDISSTIKKNRVYKHTADGAFTAQDQSTSNRDVIFYPKNEIHIPDRANLGIDNAQSQFTYTPAGGTKQALNFVFYTPNEDEEYNEDREIILPDAYTNLKQVAVVNMTNMPITARNFSRTASVVVNANAMLVISNADLSTTNTAYSLYGSLKEDEDDGLYHSVSGYRFYLSSDSVVVSDGKLYRDYEKTTSKRDRYNISREGDIVLDYNTHNGKDIIVESQPNFLRPYLYETDGSDDYINDNDENQFKPHSSETFSFRIVNVSTSSFDVSILGEPGPYSENPGILTDEDVVYRDGRLHPMVTYSAEVSNFTFVKNEEDEAVPTFIFGHISAIQGERIIIGHASSALDNSLDYQVFGKELSLSLNVYYDKITASDAEEINLGHDDAAYTLTKGKIDLSSDNEYYKIVGFGGDNVGNLNIVNTIYENIKISSVAAVDVGSNDLGGAEGKAARQSSIAAKVLSYFASDEETEPETYYLLALKDGGGGVIEQYEEETVKANYLNKNKILKLNVQDAMTPSSGPSGFVFNSTYGLEPLSDEHDPYQITFNKNSNVRVLKEKSVPLDLTVAETGQATFRHVFADQQNISLPSRKAMEAAELNNIYFTIVNASRNSSTLSSAEGTGVFSNTTIAAGAAKKIKYSNGSFSDVTSLADGVVVVDLGGKTIYSSDSGVFVASRQNSVSGALAIHKDVGSIKIVNNSKSSFHVKNYNGSKTIVGGSTYAIPAYTYCDFKVDGSENYIIDSDNRNVKLDTLRDGAVEISASVYENKVVLFDAANTKAFNITDDSYFTTTFVPLIRIKEFNNNVEIKRGGDELTRTKAWGGSYCLLNRYLDRVDFTHLKPVKFNSNKTKNVKTISCHMFEFILDESVKDKVILTNNYYDYVFKHDQRTELCLYNKDRSEINLRKLDSKNDNFKDMEEDENAYEGDLLTGSTKNKIMISCAQEGTGNPTVAELQSYTEVARPEREMLEQSTIYKNFYLNKAFYDGKILIFKDPFDIIYSAKRDNTLIGNISNSECQIFENKLSLEDIESVGFGSLPVNNSMRALLEFDEGDQRVMLRPKHLVGSKTKVTVITQPADIEYTGAGDVDGLKIINASSKAVNITAEQETNKIYSSEKVTFTDSLNLDYNLCPRFNRRDWFVSLKNIHIPHLQKDPNYFNENENSAEWKIKKKNSFNVNYIGTRYKFSNIFRTNTYRGPYIQGRSGYESVSEFDNPYIFGVTMYGDKKDAASSLLDYSLHKKEVFFDRDSSSYALNGLKFSWDMPARTIGYSVNTGHERICYCKEFNERTGMVTVSGIQKNKYYVLDDFDREYKIGDETLPVKYDFATSATRLAGDTYYAATPVIDSHKYEGIKSKEFYPVIWYNGKEYKPGEKFKGVPGKNSYQIHYNYFAVVKASMFEAAGVDESDAEIQEIIKKDTEQLDEEIAAKSVTPTWSKVTKDYQKENFLNGKLDYKVNNSAQKELILGKKLKDIEGTFTKDYFEFKIPKGSGLDYTENFTDVSQPKESDTEYILRVGFEENNIDSPGYEYEIQSSLKFTNTTGKTILSVSVDSKSSLPFIPNGTVSSLNLDFNTDAGQEYAIREGGSTYDSDITRVIAIAETDRSRSLKNQQGYSFIPFGVNSVSWQHYGLSFNISENKRAHKAIRFRLKKLTERKLIFENLKKDIEIGSYLTNESETAGLKYYLDTEVNSMSFHDIYRPGGVLKFSGTNRDWRTIGATSSDTGDAYLSNNQLVVRGAVSDGDAIVFKNSNGSIVGGKPYFARVTDQTPSGNELKNTITLLKIFSKDASLDGFNKVDGDIQDTVSSADEGNNKPGQAFKVVNYFDLETEQDGTHRAVESVLPKVYNTPEEEIPVTSLKYPIVVGSRTFYLEPPFTEINSERVDSWGTAHVLDGGKTIRANLELSTIAKHWHGEKGGGGNGIGGDTGLETDYISSPSSHWKDEDIFSSWKNLLYRFNTQIQRVSYDADTVTLNIKLNTKQGYRYIYKSNSDRIKSITLNGSAITAGTSGVIFNTNEDLKIVLEAKEGEFKDSKKVKLNDPSKDVNSTRERIFKNLCIVEEADCLIDSPAQTDGEDLLNSSYFDYQIPKLNESPSDKFKQVYSSYDREDHNGLLSYGQKGENLTASADAVPISSNSPFTAGLFYDMGMPALCKYIYPYVNAANDSLDFSIVNFWDGFTDGFGDSTEPHKVRPISFEYNLENSSNGTSWSNVEKGLVHHKEKFSIKREGLDATKKYRIAITGVNISYRDRNGEDGSKTVTEKISSIRLPFKWTSTIYDSDLSGDGILNDEVGLHQHSMNMIENADIKRSVSFPEGGLVKLGEFNFKKSHESNGGEDLKYDGKALVVPCSRLYMFDLEHKMRANYKDPINRGGISKVVITNHGANYRTPPTISIAGPDVENDSFRGATSRATIEGGRLKFIEVVNAGSGYADIDDFKTVRMEQYRSDITPIIIHNLKIAANSSAAATNKERGLDNISITDVPGLKLYKTTITGNESSLPQEEQEEFGLTYNDTEKIASYIEYDDLHKSANRGSVDFMKGSSEDDSIWGDIQAQADRIIGIKNFATSAIDQLKGSQNYGSSMPDDIKGTEDENIDGFYKEDETDSSSISNRSVEVKLQPGSDMSFTQYETYPDVEPGEAWALANNNSIAEYRVINNEIATKTTPWISSFSREDNPALPMSFGIVPGAALSAEVFNTYARAINFLHKIRVEAPIYAKIRRFKQVEYRYINNPDMAGLTFADAEDAGAENSKYWASEKELDYLTYNNKSRINYITYFDPDTNDRKVAHFSSFEAENGGLGILANGSDVSVQNPENIVNVKEDTYDTSPIWDDSDEVLRDTPEGKKFKRQPEPDGGPDHDPVGVGFPSEVNIPKKLGVHCNPPMSYYDGDVTQGNKGEGIPLPTPTNRRAYAYGGEVVYKSDIYDVTDEIWPLRFATASGYSEVSSTQFDPVEGGVLVDIRGSEYIKAGYSNQIVFGCQTAGKPFMSAFLRTVKVWTEYEVVASPDFTKTLPPGIKEKYKPEESKLRCSLIEGRSTCKEAKIGVVSKNRGLHSLCEDGWNSTFNPSYTYEDVFSLSEGDDVIGPQEDYSESSSIIQALAKGTFKVEPEFDLAMAVYGSNEYIFAVRAGTKDRIKRGPCIHFCYPGQIKTLKVSDDPLIFDLKK